MKPSQRLRLRLCATTLLFALLHLAPTPHATSSQTPATPQPDVQFQQIAPGVEYFQTTRNPQSKDENKGPWLISALRIDLHIARLKFVRALDEGVGLETVSSLATRHHAVAATNGGYFRTTGTFRGESAGTYVLDGKLLSEPYNDRAAAGLISAKDGDSLVFGHLKFSAKISNNHSSHDVAGVNRPPSTDELLIFNPEFHKTTLTTSEGVEAVVRNGRVTLVRDHEGSTRIPHDGYVLHATGKAREWVLKNIRRGMRLHFSWQLIPVEPELSARWAPARSIVGGGPMLIKNGQITITNEQEKILPAFVSDRHPRTAIAKLNSGKILLLTVDGRQPGVSAGMSLTALSDLLIEFGAVEAINLDGGGSTTMFVRDKVVNKPSDQTGERPVSDAILVFSDRK
jgi:exopolysaccharide biosynthesis protein